MRVVGADVWKRGWVTVEVTGGRVTGVVSFDSFADLITHHAGAVAIGVDIPIGLPTEPPRQADVLARRFVGPRASSVFNTPPRDVLEAPSYQEALHISRTRYGAGISAQSFALRHRIFEVEAARQGDDRLIEVHPEVSFCALAGGPLDYSKKTWNGQMLRRQLLATAGLRLPDTISGPADRVPVDDVLDAAAAAWSAARWAADRAQALPERVDEPADQTIWY